MPKHSRAKLAVSEIVTLALLFALKGSNTRHFYRWLKRDYLGLFPHLPERTRLFRLFKKNRFLANEFLADPTILGVADSFGIEMCHPVREKRFPDRARLGKKGKSNSRWNGWWETLCGIEQIRVGVRFSNRHGECFR